MHNVHSFTMTGYDPLFLGTKVALPQLSKAQRADTVPVAGSKDNLLHHQGYTVAMRASRRLAWFSSAYVDIAQQVEVRRADMTTNWKIEETIDPTKILDDEFYRSSDKVLERGHLTPVDVMEWGEDWEAARARANDTFYFSNAAPQVKRLNGREWRVLERYIGDQALLTGQTGLIVHTGPVFQEDDFLYVPSMLAGDFVQLPYLFWKVIYYKTADGQLNRIGFLMSQKELLEQSDLVSRRTDRSVEVPFGDLGPQGTYQVGVARIQELTGLRFTKAKESQPDTRPLPLIFEEVTLQTTRSGQPYAPRGYFLRGLQL